MPWATFLLLVVSGYVAFSLILLTKKKQSLKFIGLAVAACIFFLMQASMLINYYADMPVLTNISSVIVEWGHISSLALILTSLAIFVRDSKPVFAQFPMGYTAFPLLIIISYALIRDTYALKNWMLGIYQGGAILVALLMYGIYTYRRSEFGMILVGVILFLFSYVIYWYPAGMEQSYMWIWKVFLAGGMVFLLKGYEHIDRITPIQNSSNN